MSTRNKDQLHDLVGTCGRQEPKEPDRPELQAFQTSNDKREYLALSESSKDGKWIAIDPDHAITGDFR